MVDVPETVIWHDVRLSGRDSQKETRCWSPEEYCSSTVQDRRATVRLTCGVEVLKPVFRHDSRISHGCGPTGHFLSGDESL
eukprot:1758646-Pyramimonas_sp.AAC.1